MNFTNPLTCYLFYNKNGKTQIAAADPLRPETLPFPKEEIAKVYVDCTDLFLRQAPAIDHSQKKLQEILAHIASHSKENISLDFALKCMGMSKSRFSEFFKQQTGLAFVAYINKVRIEQAVRLLAETDLTCNAVGYDCGFASPSHFYKVFKGQYGVSPQKYRENDINYAYQRQKDNLLK